MGRTRGTFDVEATKSSGIKLYGGTTLLYKHVPISPYFPS